MNVSSPEVFTLADLRDRWPVDGTAPRLAVLGDPVSHSLSPPMHDAALAVRGLSIRYGRLHLKAAELEEAMSLLPARGFLGVNLTIPHKLAALGLVDALDDSARRLGAVNTVRIGADAQLTGFNTDGPGFARAVRENFGVALEGLRVMILGAGGGAGRALATQCAVSKCPRVVLVNRTQAKALSLANELVHEFGLAAGSVEVLSWQDLGSEIQVLDAVDLVVNTTSLGLGQGDPSPLGEETMRHRVQGNPSRPLCVFDTVYRRDGTPTALLTNARKVGARTADGLTLLLHQGALAFEIWFGQSAPLEVMRTALTYAIDQERKPQPPAFRLRHPAS